MQRKIQGDWRSRLLISLVVSSAVTLPSHLAVAQNITIDGTLSPARTLTGPYYRIQQEDGRVVGSNLFHSFGRFNLSAGEVARFFSDGGIRNILARVTGGTVSNIDGLLLTESTNVNLFLINPNGILFGPNASLNIGGSTGRGSFVASTTDALVWGNGKTFSARNPQGPDSLLTLVGDPSGFLTSQRTPGAIVAQGSRLDVYPDQRLLLLGGDVTINSGILQARGGRVEIGSVSGEGTVGLDLNSTGFSLKFPDDLTRGDVYITNGAIIRTNTPTTGGNGGDIVIQGGAIDLAQGAQLQASTVSTGDAGNVRVIATKSVTLREQATIFSTIEAGGVGKGGNIAVLTPQLIMNSGGQLQTSVKGPNQETGKPGGNGTPGVIFVQTNGGSVSLSGARTAMFSVINEGATASGAGSNEFAGGVFDVLLGNSNQPITGSVFIATGSLSLSNGAFLSTSTFGTGNAGAVIVDAKGAVSLTNGSAFLSRVGSSGVGSAGGIVLAAKSLLVQDSELNTSTLGQGDAGLVLALAKEQIELSGDAGIFSAAGLNTAQTAGAILLSSPKLVVRDGARISVSNIGSGPAGDVIISSPTPANAVWLTNGGYIVARTLSGQGGNISFKTPGAIILSRGGQISTEAGIIGAGGNGGNITINSGNLAINGGRTLLIAGKPTNDNDIIANAYTGRGGSIRISAFQLNDIAQRPQNLSTNDIDASSRFGLNGVVTVNALDIDPSRSALSLPAGLRDVSNLIAQRCTPGTQANTSQFIITGRSGLPPSPTAALSSEEVLTEWVAIESTGQVSDRGDARGDRGASTISSSSPSTAASAIVEAQGWIQDQQGDIYLVAQAANPTPQIPWLHSPHCH
ncbi:filamentous hemagglutinin N-terminal domain-containing protein [Pantanalinema sp. GBBB05]|uniref:two-partner secretion domain-containing protein n=1 Tax=Pantanalinema sp. GBBB05 TaxID=2604139 RepID=UPI001D772CAB|nr:filamentous hemagglutinin N-terminal domain-containing protein [Pantanalinema sp. GBBB05]